MIMKIQNQINLKNQKRLIKINKKIYEKNGIKEKLKRKIDKNENN